MPSHQQKILNYWKKFLDGGKPKKFIPGKTLIQYAGSIIGEEEFEAVLEVMAERWLGLASKAEAFEKHMAPWLGKTTGIVVNSGSSANLIACATLKSRNLPNPLTDGDEVITTASAFPTSINPIIQVGLKPVFVDVELGNYAISLQEIEKAISPRTRAILFAHTLGNSPDMNQLVNLANRHNLIIIEDCCDALGGKFNGRPLGSFGTFATTSFYPAHHITIGEGGFVAVSDKHLWKVARSIRDWGRACFCEGKDSLKENGTCGRRFSKWLEGIDEKIDHKYVYSEIGYNLKPIEMQCAIGLAQLKRLPEFIKKRKDNFNYYFERLKKWSKFFILPQWHPQCDVSWFAFPLTIRNDAPFTRMEIVKWLEDHRIQTRPLFAGNILKHPAYKNINCRIVGELANSDIICKNTFFIGVYPGLTNEMREYVANKFDEYLKKY